MKRVRTTEPSHDKEEEEEEEKEEEEEDNPKEPRIKTVKKRKKKLPPETLEIRKHAIQPWMARRTIPTELLEKSQVIRCRITRQYTDKDKFEVELIGSAGTRRKLYDTFNLMPTVSMLFKFRLLVHPESSTVTQVVQVIPSHKSLSASNYIPTSVMSRTVADRAGWRCERGFNITTLHSPFVSLKSHEQSERYARALDTYWMINQDAVERCRLYPLSTAMQCGKELVDMINTPEVWRLGFRPIGAFPPHVSPMRLAPLLDRPLEIEESVDTIIVAAMAYDDMAKNPHRIWYDTAQVPDFLFKHGFVGPHPDTLLKCCPSTALAALKEFAGWLDESKLDTAQFFWGPGRVVYLPYDHDFAAETGIQYQLMRTGCPVITMPSSEAVRGSFASFMGFPTPPAPDGRIAVVMPYLDKWTVYDLARAMDMMRHWRVFALILHGNMRAGTHLTEFIRPRIKHRSIDHARDASHPPWILPDPPLDRPPAYSVKDIPTGLAILPTYDQPMPQKGFLSFVPHTEENHACFVEWYTHLRALCNDVANPFAVQVFTYDAGSRKMWREAMNKKDAIVPGTKLLTADGTLLAVRQVLKPSSISAQPLLTAHPSAYFNHGALTWLSCSTYSPTTTDHSRCCGALRYPLPPGITFNLGMHRHELEMADTLYWGALPIPKIKFAIIYAPSPFTITPDFIRFLISTMAHATDAVLLYGISRQTLDSCVFN